MLKLLLDENIPFAAISALNEAGCDALHLKRMGKSGISDDAVYALAEAQERWIVTRDTDFQNFTKFQMSKVPGILLLRTKDSRTAALTGRLLSIVENHPDFFGSRQLLIVEDNSVRILQASDLP